MAERGTIVVVDDEANIADLVALYLDREGFRVVKAATGSDGIAAFQQHRPRLVVLDVGLPDLDGLEVCKRIRMQSQTPVIFLTARDGEIDRILGLELGGDDYVTKPFSPRELVARVKAVLRRTDGSDKEDAERRVRLEHGAISIDLERHEVRVRRDRDADAGELVALTPTELGLLASLVERPGIVLSRHQLMKRAYAYDNLVTERTIDTHVRRVRAKLRPFGVDPIATVHGVGYRAYDPNAPSSARDDDAP